MGLYVKIDDMEYPATIVGNSRDYEWGGRETKTIRLVASVSDVAALMPTGTSWSIVQRTIVDKMTEDGQAAGETEETVQVWDNSEYSLSGTITDYRDGTVSVKMGKPTDAEILATQLKEIEEAYDAN